MDDIDIRIFMKSEYNKNPNTFFNVHEIMEALGIDEEDILLVKNAMESGVDVKDYERKIKKGKPKTVTGKALYRFKEVTK